MMTYMVLFLSMTYMVLYIHMMTYTVLFLCTLRGFWVCSAYVDAYVRV